MEEDVSHASIVHAVNTKTAVLDASVKQTQADVAMLRAERREDMATIRGALEKIDTKLERHSEVVNKAMIESARLSGAQKLITALIGAGAGGAVSVIASILKKGVG